MLTRRPRHIHTERSTMRHPDQRRSAASCGAAALLVICGAAVVMPTAEAAAPDPCATGGFVSVANGKVGIPFWQYRPGYNVGVLNESRSSHGGITGDPDMQWEIGWNPRIRMANFCVRNNRATGREYIGARSARFDNRGSQLTSTSTDESVPAGSGWHEIKYYNLPRGNTARFEVFSIWGNGSMADTEVDLHAYGAGGGTNPPWW